MSEYRKLKQVQLDIFGVCIGEVFLVVIHRTDVQINFNKFSYFNAETFFSQYFWSFIYA